jgi:hypothetical protein
MVYIRRHLGEATLAEAIARVGKDVETKGLDCLGPFPSGEYAQFRPLELALAINRLRSLGIRAERR